MHGEGIMGASTALASYSVLYTTVVVVVIVVVVVVVVDDDNDLDLQLFYPYS